MGRPDDGRPLMTAPRWAEQLGAGLDPDLVVRVMTCVVSPWCHPDRLRRVLADRLERDAATDAATVIADLARPPRPSDVPPSPAAVEAVARALLAAEARLLLPLHPGYPGRLALAWPDLGAPGWLFARGAALTDAASVAVVGTRRPTLDGVRTARGLGRFLAERGVTVVSGLARGIDQAAHQGALDAGGVTTAVLGTGFGVDYPRRDGPLREAVAASGGLVTEYLPGAPPSPPHFLWRNRIVSGLADAVVVVEGQARSGALQTARLGAAQGRDVFAVPGSLSQPTSRGPLDLVRDGARLVTRFEDVLECLPALVDLAEEPEGMADVDVSVAGSRSAVAGLDPSAVTVLNLLGAAPASPGALAGAAGLPVAAALVALSELEARGLVALTGRGFVRADR